MVDQIKNKLSAHAYKEIARWVRKYPTDRRQSAVLAALHQAQHENNGYLTTALMDAVADCLDISPIAVYEVASFYSMFQTRPVGRNTIAVCTNISCMLSGADDIVSYIERKLGVKTGGSTADNKFFLKREEECLAACCGAPVMQVNHKYYENLTYEKIDKILGEFE